MRVALMALLGSLAAVAAAPRPAAAAPRKVALVPLSTLGTETSKRDMAHLSEQVAQAMSGLDNVTLVAPAVVDRSLRGSKPLAACDGATECLADAGKRAGVDYVLFGELGGLGDAQVVYFRVIGVSARRDLRSTTLEFEGETADSRAVRAAMVRMFAPSRYHGNLVLTLDVRGATVYIDGEIVPVTSGQPVAVAVGSHALRVTHPELRDFVRFIDVDFDRDTPVQASLQQFPIVASQMRKNRTEAPLVPARPAPPPATTPWYRRWYTIAGVGAGAFVAGAVVFGLLAPGIDADQTRAIGVP